MITNNMGKYYLSIFGSFEFFKQMMKNHYKTIHTYDHQCGTNDHFEFEVGDPMHLYALNFQYTRG
jgi:hypothetical protein